MGQKKIIDIHDGRSFVVRDHFDRTATSEERRSRLTISQQFRKRDGFDAAGGMRLGSKSQPP
jgi:hypothetical protein